MNTFSAQDLGGFPMDRESEDYTKSYKTMNDWFVLQFVYVHLPASTSNILLIVSVF